MKVDETRPRFRRTRRALKVAAVIAVVSIVAGATYQTVASARDAGRYPAPGRLVDIGSYSIHVNCTGTGSPTVVFESGSGGTSLDWALVQPALSKMTRTCSYDRAGYGWSDAAPDHSLARMRHDFEAVLHAERVEGSLVVVAHSFGGILALDYASRHPDRVAGIVLVDAADKATYELMDHSFPTFRSNGKKAALFIRAASVVAHLGVTRVVGQPASPKTMAPNVRGAYRAVGYRPAAYRAFADDLNAFSRYVDHARGGPLPRVPAVVLTHNNPGTLWRGVPKAEAERSWQERQRKIASQLHARHVVVRGAGHFIQVERPATVIEAIEHVLRTSR